MKIAEWRVKSADELKTALTDLRKEQFNIRFQRSSGQFTNTARIRVIRRDIARIMTLLNNPVAANVPTKTAAVKTTKPRASKTPAAKEAAPETAAKPVKKARKTTKAEE